ncbi:MAG: hypothetical protein KJ626_00220 [Verrucomicrobia bacterium]|nr:hypothetical protein [Verrucomicrobiota bacterium]
MKPATTTDIAILTINTIGFVGYLAWLVFASGEIFYTQEGVLYLLPCLPFFFVYLYLMQRLRSHGDEDPDKKE